MASDSENTEKRISLLIAEPDKAEAIASLHALCFRTAWASPDIDALLSAETALAFIATADGARQVVGFIIGRLLVDEAEIVTLGVHPECRNGGIGKRLLVGFETAAARAGALRVVLEVAEDNADARALYEAAGYAIAGRRPSYYDSGSGVPTDAILLAKLLQQVGI